MVFEEDVQRYCQQGYAKELFFKGELISVPGNCGIYLQANGVKKEACIILGSILASEATNIVKAQCGLETMLRGYEAAKEHLQEQYILLLAVDDVLQRPWSEGAQSVIPKLKTALDPQLFSSARQRYKRLYTGYGSAIGSDEEHDLLCLAIIVVQKERSFHAMLDLYLTLVESCARKSLQIDGEMFISANYEYSVNALQNAIQTTIANESFSLDSGEVRTIRGYSERLHLAGIASLSDFRKKPSSY